jgi:hypothetical protein
MNIASIDIGILHLGLVSCDVTWDRIIVNHVHLVDITKRCRRLDCKLNHTNHMVDRVDHFIQDHWDILDKADKILVEKQPITGLISVEQLLFDRLRAKVEFIYPVSMHKYFGIRKLNYDERKEFLVEKTRPHLTGSIYDTLERKHDVADAMAMIIYWRRNSGQIRHRELGKPGTPFEQFRYLGDTSGI